MDFNQEIDYSDPVQLHAIIKDLKRELISYKLIANSYQKYFNFFAEINEIIVSKKSEVLDVIKDIQSFNDLKQKKNLSENDSNETNTESNEQNFNESQERVGFTQNTNNSQTIEINANNRSSEEVEENEVMSTVLSIKCEPMSVEEYSHIDSYTTPQNVDNSLQNSNEFQYLTNILRFNVSSEEIPDQSIVKKEILSEDNTEEDSNEFQIPIDNIRHLRSNSKSGEPEDSCDQRLLIQTKTDNQRESRRKPIESYNKINEFNDNRVEESPQTIDTNEKRFKCDKCVKRFGYLSQLKVHQTFHSTERQFVCDWIQCGKRFKSPKGVYNHKRYVHLKEKKFECDLKDCKKTFFTKPNLIEHKRIHSEQKPFVCDHKNFDKRFAQKSKTNLKNHSKFSQKLDLNNL